ncbi:hypothetical protein [Actinomadura gamaensis]|uniref:Uncharacterized protein n=1 Tax=Actinomadura gamaensis TaxID=1763541 RepID=A0ABV9U317_9ACTN
MNNRVQAAIIAAAVAVAALAPATTAEAATGWRLTAAPDAGAELHDVAVVSAKDAWAVGGGKAGPLVRHWNGRTWTKVALPKAAAGASLLSVSASSSSNVWIGGHNGRSTQFWLHWNGRTWKVITGPDLSEPVAPKLLAISAKDVWSFGWKGDGPFYPDVRHYNGSRWSKVAGPGIVFEVRALSSKDIWAVGANAYRAGMAGGVYHWNGKSWKTFRPLPLTSYADYSSVVAKSAKDVWVSGRRTSGETSTPFLAHWNGSSWKQVAAPKTKQGLTALTKDGASGFWAEADGRFFHYSKGKWTSTPVPSRSGYKTAVYGMAFIPGGTSVWAVGALQDKREVARYDAILKLGR